MLAQLGPLEVKPIFVTAWAVNKALFHSVSACFVYHGLITSVLDTVLFGENRDLFQGCH